MKKLVGPLCVVASLLSSATPFASNKGYLSFDCPATLEVKQAVLKVPADFRVFEDKVNSAVRLDGVAFYDGPPEELASLKPDDERGASGWSFGPRQGGRAIWEVCRYAGTTLQLARAIPDSITTCRVNKDAYGSLRGALCR